MGWNATHASTYVNASIFGITEITEYFVVADSEGAKADETSATGLDVEGACLPGGMSKLLIGAWQVATDDIGTEARGGYYRGLMDNIEVSPHIAQISMDRIGWRVYLVKAEISCKQRGTCAI